MMNNLTIGLKSDILFFNFRNDVQEKNDYFVLSTQNNPDFYWGNYLVFKNPLSLGDFNIWKKHYRDEFFHNENIKHMCFSWAGDPCYSELNKFKENNFSFLEKMVMITNKEKFKCKYFNNEIVCKRMVTNDDWNKVLNFQLKINESLSNKKSKSYIEKRILEFKMYTNNNFGYWYAAFINGEIVSDIGLYWNHEFARLHNLKTLNEYRRKGIAQTLIKFAIDDSQQMLFTLDAEEKGLAINMYKSLGFIFKEKKYSLWSSVLS